MHQFVYKGDPIWKNCIGVKTAAPPPIRLQRQVRLALSVRPEKDIKLFQVPSNLPRDVASFVVMTPEDRRAEEKFGPVRVNTERGNVKTSMRQREDCRKAIQNLCTLFLDLRDDPRPWTRKMPDPFSVARSLCHTLSWALPPKHRAVKKWQFLGNRIRTRIHNGTITNWVLIKLVLRAIPKNDEFAVTLNMLHKLLWEAKYSPCRYRVDTFSWERMTLDPTAFNQCKENCSCKEYKYDTFNQALKYFK